MFGQYPPAACQPVTDFPIFQLGNMIRQFFGSSSLKDHAARPRFGMSDDPGWIS